VNKLLRKGEAGIFKSTSGWQDGKYYCLHNSAPIGSIVKITNTTNNKIIYAKVLDVIPDIKQNNGVVVRLSNAAADVLGAGTDNFECVINY
jgi:rare lipoprotein A (peptidoglycan hydrolase)